MANKNIMELSKLKLDELRVLAKEHQVKSYLKYRKAELISILDEILKTDDKSKENEVKSSERIHEVLEVKDNSKEEEDSIKTPIKEKLSSTKQDNKGDVSEKEESPK